MEINMQLKRSVSDRMIAGVCGGLAKEFKIDPAIIRLGFAFSTIVFGVGILPYIILWIVMPEEV